MPVYRVKYRELVTYEAYVEADNKEEAQGIVNKTKLPDPIEIGVRLHDIVSVKLDEE